MFAFNYCRKLCENLFGGAPQVEDDPETPIAAGDHLAENVAQQQQSFGDRASAAEAVKGMEGITEEVLHDAKSKLRHRHF